MAPIKPPIRLGPGGGRPSPPLDLSTLNLADLKARRDAMVERSGRLNPPITRVVSAPRAITLGGSPHVVSELRLRHLAELQAYLEECEPNPLDALPPGWADPDPETRRERLARAWEAAATWPPRLGTERGRKILASPEARAFFLALVVREHNPGFGLVEAVELLPRITPGELARLFRIVYAIHPRQEIAAELAPEAGPDKPMDWVKALHLAAAGDATAYPELGELTLSQWRVLTSGGKAFEFTAEYSALCKRAKSALSTPETNP